MIEDDPPEPMTPTESFCIGVILLFFVLIYFLS